MTRMFTNSWKGKKGLHILAIVMIFVCLMMTFFAFSNPSTIRRYNLTNTIHVKTTYSLDEPVKPNLLFPDGKTLHPKKTLTTAFSDHFIVHVQTKIDSQKRVQLKGSFQPVLVVQADGLWQKTFKLSSRKSFQKTCQNCSVNETFTIQAGEIFGFLNKVEKKLKLRPREYTFHVKPGLKGTVVSQDTSLPLDDGGGLAFRRNQNELTLTDKSKLMISKSYPLKKAVMVPHSLQFMGIQLSTHTARILFPAGLLGFILLFLLTMDFRKEEILEFVKIDRKHHKDLVSVKKQPKLEDLTELELSSFQQLLFVSEERERPVFRYESRSEVVYFVADAPNVYDYVVSKSQPEDEEDQ